MRLPDRRVLLADRRAWVVAGAAIVLVGGLLTWAWWPSVEPEPEPPRAWEYRDYTICLLTDEQGIAGPDAAPVWAGIQDAALPALVRSQHLPVGEQTADARKRKSRTRNCWTP